MTEIGPAEDWEIWAGQGLALVVAAADPDKPWLTRLMTLKYRMPGVIGPHAHLVFNRAIRGGYLIPKPHNAVQQQHQPKEDTDAP